MNPSTPQIKILGIPFSLRSKKETYQTIHSLLQTKRHIRIFTPNPEMLWNAHRDPVLHRDLLDADLLLPDGMGIILASRIQGTPLPQRITGIDTGEWLLRYAAKHDLSVFLLGGRQGVADRAKRALTARMPSLRICGTHHGFFDPQKRSPENQSVLQAIKAADPDLLFVCLGSPRQERWITENVPSLLHMRLAIGLGGALDVWSGAVRRAPQAVQHCGMEWLWRALQEPKRIGRLRYLPCFLWKITFHL